MKSTHHDVKSALGGALSLLLLLALPLAAPVVAQNELPGVFSDVIDVRVVNIEVVVTGRGGQRVSGLTADDFTLLVDGEEVPIDYFTEVRGGWAVEPAEAAAEDTVSGLPQLAPGKAVGTSYLVFIDDFFSIERDRNRALEAISRQLPLLGPEDRMALVAYDGHRLTMLSSWTNSIAGLERAIKEASRRPAYGLERITERRTVASTRNLGAFRSVAPTIGYRLTPEELDYAQRLSSQVERQVSAASATLRSFAMPPGRKVMLLLSGGWPFDPAQYVVDRQTPPVLDTQQLRRGFELYEPLAHTANLLGYTLYPVDVPGLQGDGGNLGATPTAAGVGQEQELEAALSYLARRTGGEAMLNSRWSESLEQVASDTRSYYWLGFSPQRQRDDAQHQIEVLVDRSGVDVRTRRGYLDFSRQAEVSAMVESTLLFGNAPASGALPVSVGEVKRAGRRTIEAQLSLAIPVSEITVLPVGDHWVSELELRVAALDADGNQADIPVLPLRLDAEEKPAADGYVRYDTSLTLRRIDQELVISVFDPATGRLLSNRLELKP